jgi:FkbM family methyltransferase
MCPIVLTSQAWEIGDISFSKDILGKYSAVTMIDIGGNQGFFSRQVLSAVDNVKITYVYEPVPDNFSCLQHNLSPFPGVIFQNSALGLSSSETDFFVDKGNCGNSSLTLSAMEKQPYDKIKVRMLDIRHESKKWQASEMPIFYKSDTQGYDESLMTALDMDIWERIHGGIVELWRIKKPEFPKDKLRAILDRYPNKFLLDDMSKISTDQVMNFASEVDGRFNNLGFYQ